MEYVLVGTNENLVWGDEVRFSAATNEEAVAIVESHSEWLEHYTTRKLYQNPKGNNYNWAGTFCKGYPTPTPPTENEATDDK